MKSPMMSYLHFKFLTLKKNPYKFKLNIPKQLNICIFDKLAVHRRRCVCQGRSTLQQFKMSRTFKKFSCLGRGSNRGPFDLQSSTLPRHSTKAGLYRKAVQVYDIPNHYPVTFSPSIMNSSSNFQKYKNH